MRLSKLLIPTLLVSSLFASESFIDSVGINIGHTKTFPSGNSNNTQVDDAPDKVFTNYEIYTTLKPLLKLCKENNLKPTIAYNYANNSELTNQNLLLSINKYHTQDSITFYGGIILGYGQMQWDYEPIDSNKNDTKSDSFIYGFQTGIQTKVQDNLFFNINLKGLYHNYEAKIITPTNETTIKHDNSVVGAVGIGYRF